ncbi:rho guanine nucleotide exchange factor 7 isoform X1 [Corythoichthys intestinalis]|uniref:rho guanine nucleotide exchange factor 7 isoform X1 n=1 Tax=Corythoichthys intestinalis TaxID=161448 RepID=UPI0025A545F7|nr:rho guanine nucleotide exchange factor 7 isoform X1 [Corythoichthys intestinalis]
MMGCCSVTQRHTGVDEVGPDEIELLELSGDHLGVWSLGETRLQLSVRCSKDDKQPPSRCSLLPLMEKQHTHTGVLWGKSRGELHQRIYSKQPIKGWEGRPAHMYGEIIHSSLVYLHNKYSQENREHFLVLFSFHLLLLSLDHIQQDFIYEGLLPLSGISFQVITMDSDISQSPHMFEISSSMVDPKIFICSNAAELQTWMKHIEDRRYKSRTQSMSPSHCALSYLLPCDELWKREELKKYLMHAPIWEWEGLPIQHMGLPGYISVVHIINSHRQGLQERLMILFPQDILLLSVDNKQLNITYQGRLPRRGVKATEKSCQPGRLEFELRGELLEPLQVSCTCLEDYQNWIFHLQQTETSTLKLAPLHQHSCQSCAGAAKKPSPLTNIMLMDAVKCRIVLPGL